MNVVTMKLITFILFALLPFATALPKIFPRDSTKGYGPHHVRCKSGKTYTIDFSFAVSVPTIANVSDLTPTINYGGYRFALPRDAINGLLVSFLGNFDTNQTTM